MILRSIEVEGFRCFDRLLTIGEFAPGLNILSGPNGAGKSTLLRALRHVLVDAHSLSGTSVKQAMAPWGRALSPRIRIAMEHGGTEWRLEKKFLSGAYARLEREESGVFRPLAEGKEAEARVRAMFLAEAAPKGLAGESHLGLLQVLWTPQGAPLLPDWSAGVRTTLQEAFGAALSSRAADQLAKRIDERFLEYFTPTGQVKKSSPVVPLQAEVATLRVQLQAAREQWQKATLNRQVLSTLRSRIDEYSVRLNAELPLLDRARQWRREFAEATTAELRARQAYATLDTQQKLEQRVQEEEMRHGVLLADLAAAQAAQPKLQHLESELEALHQSGIDAKAWPDWLRLQALTGERAALRKQLAEIQAPDAKTIAELRRVQQQMEIKQASLDAASLKLTIEAEQDLTVETAGGPRDLPAGESLPIASAQSISFRIPGIARITAASANAQATGFAKEVEQLQSQRAGLLRGESLAELETRFARAEALQQALAAVEAECRPLDARRSDLEELARRRPDWTQSPDLDSVRVAWKACRDNLDALKAQFNLPALSAAEAGARATVAAIKAQIVPQPASSSLEDAQVAFLEARARLDALKAAEPADSATLEHSVVALQSAIGADKEATARAEGELATVQAQRVYTVLAETEERLSERTASLERESRRAAAIQLLKTTLAAAQSNLTAALPDQIALQATRYWRQIAGPDAPPIRMDQSWKPVGLSIPNAAPELQELSGGEAEQVTFATRLALATQLAQHTRQLAVFDDAFLATDPVRASRILELIAAAAERLQIIVLTCHPERYQALAGVQRFNL